MAYNCKGKVKAELAVIINIKYNYNEVPLQPSRTPPYFPIPIDDPIDNEDEDCPYSRRKSIKFADLPKFFN